MLSWPLFIVVFLFALRSDSSDEPAYIFFSLFFSAFSLPPQNKAFLSFSFFRILMYANEKKKDTFLSLNMYWRTQEQQRGDKQQCEVKCLKIDLLFLSVAA